MSRESPFAAHLPKNKNPAGARPSDACVGYTGFFPKHLQDDQHEFDTIPNRNTRYNIPGYMGYIPQVKAENIFGQSYSKISGMSRQGLIPAKKGDPLHNHFNNITQDDKFRSTFQE